MVGAQLHGFGDVTAAHRDFVSAFWILTFGVALGRGLARHDSVAAGFAAALGVAASMCVAPGVAGARDEIPLRTGAKRKCHRGTSLAGADGAGLRGAQRLENAGERVLSDVVRAVIVAPQFIGER